MGWQASVCLQSICEEAERRPKIPTRNPAENPIPKPRRPFCVSRRKRRNCVPVWFGRMVFPHARAQQQTCARNGLLISACDGIPTIFSGRFRQKRMLVSLSNCSAEWVTAWVLPLARSSVISLLFSSKNHSARGNRTALPFLMLRNRRARSSERIQRQNRTSREMMSAMSLSSRSRPWRMSGPRNITRGRLLPVKTGRISTTCASSGTTTRNSSHTATSHHRRAVPTRVRAFRRCAPPFARPGLCPPTTNTWHQLPGIYAQNKIKQLDFF